MVNMNKIGQTTPINEPVVDRFALNVGSAVHFYRIRKGLTIADLATQVGVNKSSISKIENGKQGYTGETIKKIAEALDISATEILNLLKRTLQLKKQMSILIGKKKRRTPVLKLLKIQFTTG